jgi:hypothetical protein
MSINYWNNIKLSKIQQLCADWLWNEKEYPCLIETEIMINIMLTTYKYPPRFAHFSITPKQSVYGLLWGCVSKNVPKSIVQEICNIEAKKIINFHRNMRSFRRLRVTRKVKLFAKNLSLGNFIKKYNSTPFYKQPFSFPFGNLNIIEKSIYEKMQLIGC